MTVVNLFGDLALDTSVQGVKTAIQDVTKLGTSGNSDKSLTIQPKQTDTWSWSFADTVSNGVDTNYATLLQTGSGMTVNQTGGNLLITTGTTINSETIIRALQPIQGRFRFEYLLALSQRIINQNFVLELTDILGDSLAFTVNSTTSITVTKTGHGLDTTKDVGKNISICAINGVAAQPQLATIASLTANTITLTVTAFPASGSGTCTLYGMNMHQLWYNGASATAMNSGGASGYCVYRKGRGQGSNPGINTTASPGHIGIIDATKPFDSSYLDQVTGTATTIQSLPRVVHNQNIPGDNVQYYIQIRVYNGSTAPASTTTLTLGFIRHEISNPIQASIAAVQPVGYKNALPVTVQNSTTVTGTVTATVSNATIASGTVNSQGALPGIITDVASAAITTTTTTAAFTPTFGVSYTINIPVTAVSGTNPTMDIIVQESKNSGTDRDNVYQFPRITAIGSYDSLPLKLTGNRVRYIQTIGGTTPSFTRAINRLQSTHTAPMVRQYIDRTIVATTLNSTTASVLMRGCTKLSIQIDGGAMTTPPVLTFEGSPDGVTRGNIATNNATYTAVASSLQTYNMGGYSPLLSQYVRVRVSTAGASSIINAIYFIGME